MLAVSVGVLIALSGAFALTALLLRVRTMENERRTKERLQRWEPLMLDVLAGAAPDDALLGTVAPGDESRFLAFLLGYARRLQGEERRIVARLAQPYLPGLAGSLGRGSAERRAKAVQTLATLGLPEYASHVAAALDDRSSVVAMIAARGLFRRGYEEHFPVVLAHLPRFTVWSRSFLASMLARGGPGAAPYLRTTLADGGRDGTVRAVAADALRLLNDIESTNIVPAILSDRRNRDRELVTACVRIIRHLGHQEHVALVRPLVGAADPIVRAAAVGALGAIGGPREVPILQEVLDDVAYWVSLEAARGLMKLGAVDTLQRLASSSGPWAVLARQVLAE